MTDLLPDLSEEEFEKAFLEIDLDGGGMIEFDEFNWLIGLLVHFVWESFWSPSHACPVLVVAFSLALLIRPVGMGQSTSDFPPSG